MQTCDALIVLLSVTLCMHKSKLLLTDPRDTVPHAHRRHRVAHGCTQSV